jgi:DNA-binding transcriptional LysR family regulator
LVVAGAQNGWVGRRKIELAQLLDEPWVLTPREAAPGALIAGIFHQLGLTIPQAVVVTNSIQMMSALLASGPFLAMYPRCILRLGTKHWAPKILPVILPDQSAPVGIVTLKNRTLSSTARLFIDCVREVAKPLTKPR